MLNSHNSTRETPSRHYMFSQTYVEIWETLMEWWLRGHVADKQRYITGGDSFQAFWRTITADRKGFPMKRLTDDDIAIDKAIFLAIRYGAEKYHKLKGLRCFKMIKEMMGNWQFCLTDWNYFSMIPVGSEPGDILVVLAGAKVPLVLRSCRCDNAQDTYSYLIIGGAYVHNWMDGEVSTAGFEEQIFSIA
jgi:hypothetical protein